MRKVILLLIIILPLLVFAREYTLDELIETGLKKSFEITQQQINKENADAAHKSNYLAWLPSLNVSASKSYVDGTLNDASGSFSLSENLSSNEPRYFNMKTGALDKENSVLTYEKMRKQIVFDIFNKYVAILETQKSLDIRKENYQLQKRIHQQIKLRFESGERSSLDLHQSELSLLDNQISLDQSENELRKMRQDIFAYLNEIDEGYLFSEPEFSSAETGYDLNRNFDLLISENNLKKSKISLIQRKLSLYPILSSGFNWSFRNGQYGFLNVPKYQDSYAFSLNFSYSIFDIFQKKLDLSRTKRDLRLQKLMHQDLLKKDQIKLNNLQSDIETLLRSKELYAQKVKLAEENLDMAREKYQMGLLSVIDLDKIVLDYSNAQLSYNKKYYEIIRKREELNLLTSAKILEKW